MDGDAPPATRHTGAMWTIEAMPAQRGRVAVVTGANGGLGFEVALALAGLGAVVVMAGRGQDKGRAAQAAITTAVPDASLELYELDLADLASVRGCAEAIATEHPRIDLLVNNAGVMGVPRQATVDGFELQLGVNHLGHFALTNRLIRPLLSAPAARVVSVTSFARFVGTPVDPANPHLHGRYDPWRAYSQSKLANLLFAVELQRRLAAAGASVLSLPAHPGLVHTELQARSVEASRGGTSQRFWHAAARTAGMSPRRGALPLLRAATDPDARAGRLYGPRWVAFGAPVHRPIVPRAARVGEILWAVSEQETGEAFAIGDVSPAG